MVLDVRADGADGTVNGVAHGLEPIGRTGIRSGVRTAVRVQFPAERPAAVVVPSSSRSSAARSGQGAGPDDLAGAHVEERGA